MTTLEHLARTIAVARHGTDAMWANYLESAKAVEKTHVKVKQLDWRPFERVWTARTPFTFGYGVMPWYEISGDWTVRINGKEFARAPDESSAKAAAQADYEQRVLSALER